MYRIEFYDYDYDFCNQTIGMVKSFVKEFPSYVALYKFLKTNSLYRMSDEQIIFCGKRIVKKLPFFV